MSDEVYLQIKNTIEQDGIIHVNSYEEFRNAVDVTFNERMRLKNPKFQQYLSYVSWELTYAQICDDSLLEKMNPHVLKVCRENWGKNVYLNDKKDMMWTLIGLEKTEEDNYYILRNEKSQRIYETCVSKITPVL